MRIGFIVNSNSYITSFGPIFNELNRRGIEYYVFASALVGIKPEYNPFLHQEFIKKFSKNIFWYKSYDELSRQIDDALIDLVLCIESVPFVLAPEMFRKRKYKVYSIVHNVDNFHPKAIEYGVVDKTIVPNKRYGEYLQWKSNTYIPLGSPKYDVIPSLKKESIIKKYSLPNKYILLFLPNNNLINPIIIFKIIRRIKKAGYNVVIKGKKPKCFLPVYKYFKYLFLNDSSYFPYISHELVYASSGVVGFDTTAVEEVLMLEKPLVNFSIKSYRNKSINFKQYLPMWSSDFCLDINISNNFKIRKTIFWANIPSFTNHFTKNFDYISLQKKIFFNSKNVSKNIVDYLIELC